MVLKYKQNDLFSGHLSTTNFQRVYPGLNPGLCGVRISSEKIRLFNAKVHFVS
jgi:hypothetical protein